mmetsp:Transcript_150641/g.266443  ORF Transcript_150641/g.266443 Transcript_150641/m.266443 type:complete len:96 (-) Transcript_150641:6-293(-)
MRSAWVETVDNIMKGNDGGQPASKANWPTLLEYGGAGGEIRIFCYKVHILITALEGAEQTRCAIIMAPCDMHVFSNSPQQGCGLKRKIIENTGKS